MDLNKPLNIMHIACEMITTSEINQNLEFESIYPYSSESEILCHLLNLNETSLFETNAEQYKILEKFDNQIVYIEKNINNKENNDTYIELIWVPVIYNKNVSIYEMRHNSSTFNSLWGVTIKPKFGHWGFWKRDHAKLFPIYKLLGFAIMFNQVNAFS